MQKTTKAGLALTAFLAALSGGCSSSTGGAGGSSGGAKGMGGVGAGGQGGTGGGASSLAGGGNDGGGAATGGSSGNGGGGTGTGGARTGGADGSAAAGGSGAGGAPTGGSTSDAGRSTGGSAGTGGRTGGGGVGGSAGTAATGGTTGAGGAAGNSGRDAAADAYVSPDGKSDLPPVQTNLPPGVSALFPPPGSQDICPDPVLRITFSAPPTLGSTGKIQVFNSSGTAVATVDMSASTITDTIGGSSFVVLRPVFVDGKDAVIYLKQKALAYAQSYYVRVDSGAIVPPAGGTLAITDTTTWTFTTAAAKPSSLAALTVALDGSGQFCTVQGALDALPANNSAASAITINTGLYHEIVYVSGKSNVTLHGQDRKQTIILGTNNNTQQGSAASTSNRALMGFRNTNGLTIENLTIHNLTPQGGSQAEALAMQGCDKCSVRDADILSLQDTLLWSGRIYAKNCYVAGNVDFVWGTGAAYFDSCEIKTVGRSGYVVQARNPSSSYGYVFVDSKITADSGVTGIVLARIDVSAYPASHVAYINCQMGSYISPAGWTVTGGTDTSALRFWEYQSVDSSGTAIDTSKRTSGVQISAAQAASMRDPTVVLAGWQP